MSDWLGVLKTTLKQYAKGETDAFSKRSVAFAYLKDRGKMTTRQTGQKVNWKIKTGIPNPGPYVDAAARQTLQRNNYWQEAELDWCAYDWREGLSKMDLLKNQAGPTQIIDMMKSTISGQTEGFQRQFAIDFYKDGNLGANLGRIHGIESFFGAGSTLGNGVFNPDDTYAGLDTDLGAIDGSAPSGGTWPDGVLTTPAYDCWSPLILSSTSTAFGNGATWKENCDNIVQHALTWSGRNGQGTPPARTILTDSIYYNAFLAQQRVKERFVASDTLSTAYKTGRQSVNFGGVDIVCDFDCPSSTAYGIVWEVMELKSMQPEMFVTDQEYCSDQKMWKLGIDFYGALINYTIRGHFKIAELGS